MTAPFRRILFGSALCVATSVSTAFPACAQNAAQNVGDEWFPFVMPWDDATKNAIDVSHLNPAPLTNQHRVEARDGHFYDQTGRRVRFLGVNFVYSTNFPDKDIAAPMAARMRKFGVNLVRLHHMDTLKAPNGIFPANSTNTRTLDAEQLDRLDFLVSELKKNGIYVDLNLLVGRRVNAADGMAEAGNLPNYSRVVSWFDPHHIQLQKEYAKALLDRVNPYTGVRWADDPVLALVEFNNEDTILGPNRAELLRNLSPHYKNQLVQGWNEFLKAKYGSTEKMLAAWNVGTQPYDANRLPALSDWKSDGALQTASEPSGNAAIEGRALKLQSAGRGELSASNLSFKRGENLRLRFWAKSSTPNRNVNLQLRLQDAPTKSLGLNRNLAISTEWKRYSFPFKAPADVANGGEFVAAINGTQGEIWLADVTLQSGTAIELEREQDLEKGNIELPLLTATPQGADFAAYTMEIEARYADTMRDYVQNTLGVRAPVTGSQSGWGGLGGVKRESRMDFVDMHAYWDHPDTFDPQKFAIKNWPMVRQKEGATLATLAMARVAGKPYTVSEYNHAVPNDFRVETLPFLAAFAAWQDWDGIFLFDYHSNQKTIRGNDQIRTFFSVDSDPAKMALFPAAARLFLGGEMPTASPATLVVPNSQVPRLFAENNGGELWRLWSRAGLGGKELLSYQNGVRFSDDAGELRLEKAETKGNSFAWHADDPASAHLRVVTPNSRFLVGFPSASWQNFDGFSVKPQNANQFQAVTLSSLDEKPVSDSRSLLLTVASRFENQNMTWNEARTTLSGWGSGPTRAQGVAGEITLQTSARGATVYALDASGKRGPVVPSQLQNGTLSFQIGPKFQTVWYEIAAQ